MMIENATIDNAPLIATAILEAVGADITNNLAGGRGEKIVKDLFEELARRDDSQYSYRNTRVAKNDNGEIMGLCISYDGQDLKKLRRSFFELANEKLGWSMSREEVDALPGETEDEEYYLDTLTTFPQFRGQGVASALIKDALSKASLVRKPLGLLCDINNHGARKLYDSLGFVVKGHKPFAGHMMNHMSLISHGL